jgi:hypothetical protein
MLPLLGLQQAQLLLMSLLVQAVQQGWGWVWCQRRM